MALEAKKYYESGVKGLRKVQVICDAFFLQKATTSGFEHRAKESREGGFMETSDYWRGL